MERKITDFGAFGALKSNSLFAVVDPDEGAAIDQNKKITASNMLGFFASASHNHAGVYEPAFSKNTAFNKNFGTSVGTVAQGNHTHALGDMTDVTWSGVAAGDFMYYGGSVWTNLPIADVRTVLGMWRTTGTSSLSGDVTIDQAANTMLNIGDAAGTGTNEISARFDNGKTVGGTRILYLNSFESSGAAKGAQITVQSVAGVSAGITLSAAFGGGNTFSISLNSATGAIVTTTDSKGFQYAADYSASFVDNSAVSKKYVDDAISGIGGVPAGAANEIQKTDGAGNFDNTGLFSASDGDLTLGTGLAGSVRTITAAGSSTPVDLVLTPSGVDSDIYLGQGSSTGYCYLGGTSLTGTERRFSVAGSQANIDLTISAKGTGMVLMDSPLRFAEYTAGTLPAAATYDEGIIYITDEDALAISDGADWLRLGIVDGGSSEQDGATYTIDCDNQVQYKEKIKTDETTSTWTVSNLYFDCLAFIEYDGSGTKDITLTGTNMVFVNMVSKVAIASAATTLALQLTDTGYSYELSITDTHIVNGSGKRVIHVSLL